MNFQREYYKLRRELKKLRLKSTGEIVGVLKMLTELYHETCYITPMPEGLVDARIEARKLLREHKIL